MPSTSLSSSTTEDVERIARFMGWSKCTPEDPSISATGSFWIADDVQPDFPPYVRVAFGFSDLDVLSWSPFTDANADLQVLERVREVWGESINWTRFVLAFSRPLLDTLSLRHASPHVTLSVALGKYSAGAYSVAALAVLREMEEG